MQKKAIWHNFLYKSLRDSNVPTVFVRMTNKWRREQSQTSVPDSP